MICSCGPKHHEKGCVIPLQQVTGAETFLFEWVSKNGKTKLRFQTEQQMKTFAAEHTRAYNQCPPLIQTK